MNKKIHTTATHGDRIFHLVLNSPHNLNALDLDMADAFRSLTRRLHNGPRYRAIFIRGEGRAFSAGGDLEMLRLKAQKSVAQNEREMMEFYLSFLGLRELGIPLICGLHGHVVGAGFCFAAACDLRFADETAKFAAPFSRLALHPGMGGSYFLPKTLGSETARELMLSGRRMGAKEAERRGFLSFVTTSSDLVKGAEPLLEGLLKSAPLATQALIRSERQADEQPLGQALGNEARQQALCYAREEFLEGIVALQNKQSPPWA